jgi:hypothetical protein
MYENEKSQFKKITLLYMKRIVEIFDDILTV